jgi:hypothetical protein
VFPQDLSLCSVGVIDIEVRAARVEEVVLSVAFKK